MTSLSDVVNSNDDATIFTFREAINASHLSTDTIQFASTLTANGPATIVLTNGELNIGALSTKWTIIGPGADRMAISGNNNNNNNNRIFNIQSGGALSLQGLTLRNGKGSSGGSIINAGTLEVFDCEFVSNSTTGDGGAINNSANLRVERSSFLSNSAQLNAGAIAGILGSSTLIVNSTFAGNTAARYGGAIDINSSSSTIVNSTIISNRAQSANGGVGTGGGISNFGNVTLQNSIVAGNTMLTTNADSDITNNSVTPLSSNNIVGHAGSSGGLIHQVDGNIVGNFGSGKLSLDTIFAPATTLNGNLPTVNYYGGFTRTYNLTSGSLAIDAGVPKDYRAEVFADYPLVYYPMNELVGNVIYDATSASLDAAINPTGIQLGRPSLPGLGTSPRFRNGSPDSSIAVPDLGTQSSITIEAWINPSNRPLAGDFDVIFDSRNNAAGAVHLELLNSGALQFSISNAPAVSFGSALSFPLNNWTHVVLTYNDTANQAEAFANGISLGTVAINGDQAAVFGLADIGTWNDNGNIVREFGGQLDEVAIYSTILPLNRIQSHYRAGFAPATDQRGEARFRDIPNLNDVGAQSDIGAMEAGRAVIDLSTLGPIGTTIYGAKANDMSGSALSNAGDVNGDGFDDFIVGAPGADFLGNFRLGAGESYLIFGKANFSESSTIDLLNLGYTGIKLVGADTYDGSGVSVSGAGDINGDGFDDLIVGAQLADGFENTKPYAGESYVIFGKADWSATLEVDLGLLGSAGITIFGADDRDSSGHSVSRAGDVNGDGFDDLVIGAYNADALANAKSYAGETYVIFGAALLPTVINLANLSTAGITIFGADVGDKSGRSVSDAGDVNGDGFDDLIIGAYTADALGNAKSNAGESYIIFGGPLLPATIDLANLGSAGIKILGAEANDRSGQNVHGAGDINGDGFDDFIIGAPSADASGNSKPLAGESYVVFGAAHLPSTIDLANLGAAGITVFGSDAFDLSGISVIGTGDVNGDGFDDLMIGAYLSRGLGNARLQSGECYIVFGSASLPESIDLAGIGSAGITIYGRSPGDESGFALSSAGDLNGDGFDDLVIGTLGADALNHQRTQAGESYVIFGGNVFTHSILRANLGTNATNAISGTSDAQIFNGADGDDILVGLGGADVLLGGRGNDTMAISDLNFKRIVGGHGSDTLRLDGAGLSLNLNSIADNRIIDIETIDITGSGNNSLILTPQEVLNVSSETNSLIVRRDADDVVNIGSGWTQLDNETLGGTTYLVYAQGIARLKIQLAGTATTINRQIFYNRSTSTVFGNGSGNPIDAIDTTKTALLPGQTASINHYTNYNRGLNGIIVDVANVGGFVTANDFEFDTWDGMDVQGFISAAAVPTISILPGLGVSGSTRLKVEFADNAIQNTWLRITMLANANTGLATNDVFYFGNAIGDMNAGNFGSPTIVRTNATDTSSVRQNQSPIIDSVSIQNLYDVNKDGRVTATDTSLVRQNQQGSIIQFFTAPTNLPMAPALLSKWYASISVPLLDADLQDQPNLTNMIEPWVGSSKSDCNVTNGVISSSVSLTPLSSKNPINNSPSASKTKGSGQIAFGTRIVILDWF